MAAAFLTLALVLTSCLTLGLIKGRVRLIRRPCWVELCGFMVPTGIAKGEGCIQEKPGEQHKYVVTPDLASRTNGG